MKLRPPPKFCHWSFEGVYQAKYFTLLLAGFVDETQNSVRKFSRNKLRKGNAIHSDKIDYVMVTSLSCQVFVDHYQKLLNSENYVTRRQSLKVGGASSMCQSFQYFSLFMHIKTIDSSV